MHTRCQACVIALYGCAGTFRLSRSRLDQPSWSGDPQEPDAHFFSAYTMGALAAAQLFAAARAADPDIEPGLTCGDFAPLYHWLPETVHGQGSPLSTDACWNRRPARR